MSPGAALRQKACTSGVVMLLVITACGRAEPLTLGVAADEVTTVRRLAEAVAAPVGVYGWYQAWAGRPAFDAARADAAVAAGALPMLTWEPWDPAGGPEQPEYALDRLAAGDHDDYVAAVADQMRDWGRPLALRVLHELDASHYPWGSGVNSNTPEDAVAAWRHLREIFAAQGATNVIWVWCVNVHFPGSAPYAPLYPGDDAVDWVALDGYNGGTALPWGGWRTPEEIFGASVSDLREISDRPLAITEVASAEQGGDKAAWILDLVDFAVDHQVRVLVWFEDRKEADWRVMGSPEATAALRSAVGVPGRLGPPPTEPGRVPVEPGVESAPR